MYKKYSGALDGNSSIIPQIDVTTGTYKVIYCQGVDIFFSMHYIIYIWQTRLLTQQR